MSKTRLLATASIAIIAHCRIAHAQPGAEVPGQSVASAPAPAISGTPTPANTDQPTTATAGEIIVTAQKRSERLSTVPISITAVTASQLNSTASKNLVELQGIVPGVTFPAATSYGGAPIVIRGVSGQGVFLEDDPVAVYVDGIYQPSNSRFAVADLTDIDSVEIVRGPQGTLQGRNATAGAILVKTADPGRTFGGFARASVADPFEYRFEGAATVPVTDTLGVRISGDYFDQRGFAKNLFDGRYIGGETAANIRGVFLWKPDSRFSARLAINYQSLISTQASARWAYTAVNPTGQAVTAPTPYVSLPPNLQGRFLDNTVDLNVRSRNKQTSPSGSLELHYDFGSVELVSLTGLSSAANDGQANSAGLGSSGTNGVSLVDSVTGELREGYNIGHITGHQVTQEVRLQSTGNTRFKWLIGGYASRAVDAFTFNIYNLRFTSPGNTIVGFTADQVDKSRAAFADATYKLTDKLAITGGVRYTFEDKKFENTFSLTNFNSGFTFVGPIPYHPPLTGFNDMSYRANLNYQASRDLLLYVNYSRGFKSGGFNAFGAGPQPAFNPEVLKSVEVGAKASFLNRRAYVAASGYYNDYSNLQVTAGVPTGGVIIQNAATAKVTGFEIEGQFKPVARLSITGNVAYTDATYSSFKNAQAVDGSIVDASGNRLPNTPRWQYFAQADYSFDPFKGFTGNLELNWRWRDSVNFFGTNATDNLVGRPDGELGARLDLTRTASDVTLSLYGKNLNNRRVVASEQVQFAYPVAFFNEPRVVGVQLSKRF